MPEVTVGWRQLEGLVPTKRAVTLCAALAVLTALVLAPAGQAAPKKPPPPSPKSSLALSTDVYYNGSTKLWGIGTGSGLKAGSRLTAHWTDNNGSPQTSVLGTAVASNGTVKVTNLFPCSLSGFSNFYLTGVSTSGATVTSNVVATAPCSPPGSLVLTTEVYYNGPSKLWDVITGSGLKPDTHLTAHWTDGDGNPVAVTPGATVEADGTITIRNLFTCRENDFTNFYYTGVSPDGATVTSNVVATVPCSPPGSLALSTEIGYNGPYKQWGVGTGSGLKPGTRVTSHWTDSNGNADAGTSAATVAADGTITLTNLFSCSVSGYSNFYLTGVSPDDETVTSNVVAAAPCTPAATLEFQTTVYPDDPATPDLFDPSWGHIHGTGLLPGSTVQVHALIDNTAFHGSIGEVQADGTFDFRTTQHGVWNCNDGDTVNQAYVTGTTADNQPITSNSVQEQSC